MRRRTHRWTEGANPSLVEVVEAERAGADEYRIVARSPGRKLGKLAPRGPEGGSVVGLDLSLRATACCAIPLAWDQDLAGVRTKILGAELTREATGEQTIDRMIDIADGVIAFCREVQARRIFIENHAFGKGGANANQTIEMTGIVKAWIRERWDVETVPVAASSARKTLLQHVPNPRGQPKGFVKKFVARNVERLGPVAAAWTLDERDAFVVANHGLMVVGGVAMTFLGE